MEGQRQSALRTTNRSQRRVCLEVRTRKEKYVSSLVAVRDREMPQLVHLSARRVTLTTVPQLATPRIKKATLEFSGMMRKTRLIHPYRRSDKARNLTTLAARSTGRCSIQSSSLNHYQVRETRSQPIHAKRIPALPTLWEWLAFLATPKIAPHPSTQVARRPCLSRTKMRLCRSCLTWIARPSMPS